MSTPKKTWFLERAKKFFFYPVQSDLFYNIFAMTEGKLLAAFEKVEITPRYSVHLGGYFNKRVSEGVLDPLHMRLAALSDGEHRFLFIQVENCAISTPDAEDIRNRIARESEYQKHEIMLFTSHIHTGPDLIGFFGLPKEKRYLEDLKRMVVEAAVRLNPQASVSLSFARATYERLAYNRRWVMKGGGVVTNPPKNSTERLRPEGSVDREANTIVFKDEGGRIQALFVNISNHTDTIGGNMISADWPGFMERHLNKLLETDIPVFLFLAPQGNINHFEFESERAQTNYQEAQRLGRAYAEIVASSLTHLKPFSLKGGASPAQSLEAREILLPIPARKISAAEIEKAEEILSRKEGRKENQGRPLTAEDLAKNHATVEWLFARELVELAKNMPKNYRVPLQAVKLGSVAFAAIPGEPFVEVGLELKNIAPFELVFPVALANGYFGYIPLRKNFGRGGYETRTSSASFLAEDAADRILEAFRFLLAF